MTLSSILVPVDFSLLTPALVQYAAVLAGATGARIELLHVLEPKPAKPTGIPPHACLQRAETKLLELATAPELATLTVGTHVRTGEPETEIPAAAADFGADLLLIGSHGSSGLARFLMGSTAEAVLRAAPCRTLLVTASPLPEPIAQ